MSDQERETSDLIGAEAAVWTIVWLFVIFACFYWIGALAGVIAVLVAVVLSGWLIVRAIGRNDTSG